MANAVDRINIRPMHSGSSSDRPREASALERIVPWRVRQWMKQRRNRAALAEQVGLLLRGEARVPDRAQLERLSRAFGNEDWSLSVETLEAAAGLALASTGPILECGSGLSTLLMAALTRSRGTPIVSLENDARWHARMSELSSAFKLDHVRLVLAPLSQRPAGYAWYTPPESAFSGVAPFTYVLCDGPPGDTPGGRYGLMPEMSRRLARGCVVQLDDTHRPAEQAVVERWRTEHRGATVEPRGRYALLRLDG